MLLAVKNLMMYLGASVLQSLVLCAVTFQNTVEVVWPASLYKLETCLMHTKYDLNFLLCCAKHKCPLYKNDQVLIVKT